MTQRELDGLGKGETFFIDNLMVQIHFIIEMIWWTGLAPWEFEFPFPGSLTSTFLCGRISAEMAQQELGGLFPSLCDLHEARARRALPWYQQDLDGLSTGSCVDGDGCWQDFSGDDAARARRAREGRVLRWEGQSSRDTKLR